ncbi:MAG: hypothetical protein ABWX73_13635 [Marmoricola sp.]
MTQRGRFVLVVLALTGFAAAMVAGHHPWDGPELFGITETHGVNLGDLPVVAVWVAGIVYSAGRWRRS